MSETNYGVDLTKIDRIITQLESGTLTGKELEESYKKIQIMKSSLDVQYKVSLENFNKALAECDKNDPNVKLLKETMEDKELSEEERTKKIDSAVAGLQLEIQEGFKAVKEYRSMIDKQIKKDTPTEA